MTYLRYFMSLICSNVGCSPFKASTSRLSFTHTSDLFAKMNQTLERRLAVVSL